MRITTFLVAATLALTGFAPAAPAARRRRQPAREDERLLRRPGLHTRRCGSATTRTTPWQARSRTSIATKPGARWFGNWSGDVRTAVDRFTYAADVADKLPVLVAYNIPGRDCGGESTGGAGSPQAYRDWISAFADGIGGKPAVVIIEPDALAQLDCLPGDARRPGSTC